MTKTRILRAALVTAVAAGTVIATAPIAPAAPAPTLGVIVTLHDGTADPAAVAADLLGGQKDKVGYVYTKALKGFSASLPQALISTLKGDARVKSIQPDLVHTIQATQTPTPSWGLDRIDQRDLPLNNSYTYTSTGSGVKAYVIDTGLVLGHPDFGGRASSGTDAIDGGTADDCHGHGTHVGGTIGGTKYGVAKNASLVAVRVLNCQGSGTTAQVVAGINWVIGNHQAGQPAVANMSLGGTADAAIDTAVRNLVADGVTVAVAAGNDTANSCSGSPSRVAEAITVGASDQNDARASFSNGGTCVDLFAPGVNITSDWLSNGTNTISGTSMATPHVAGVAAQYLATSPSSSPSQVAAALNGKTTKGKVTGATFRSCVLIIFCTTVNTPNNHLLFTDY
jgi:hypothetical protein